MVTIQVRARSILFQLICIFLLLLLPVQILGLMIFNASNLAMQAAVKTSALANATFLVNNLEMQIENINTQLSQIVYENDTELRAFGIQPQKDSTVEYWLKLRKILDKLSLVQRYNVLIDDMTLYYPQHNLFLSGKTGAYPVELADYETELTLFDRQEKRGMTNGGGWLFIGRVYPIRTGAQEPILFLQARVTIAKLREYFSGMISASQYGTVFIDDEQETPLLSLYGAPHEYATLQKAIAMGEWEGSRVVSVHSNQLNCTLIQFIPIEEMFSETHQLTRWLGFFMLSCIPVVVVYSLLVRRLVRRPIEQMLGAFTNVQEGKLSVALPAQARSKEFNLLFRHFNAMVHKLGDLIDHVYRQELYVKQMELKQLQAQIDPHFLYNSLFILKHLIQNEDHESASEMANYLGLYFRYMTRNGAQETELSNEYQYTSVYLEIQRIRFGNRMKAELAPLPACYVNLLVPRLILQPIVENSLKYGIQSGGIICVTFDPRDDALRISVEDSGERLTEQMLSDLRKQLDTPETQRETTALINIHRRLLLRYGDSAGLEIGRGVLGGMCVTICIPVGEESDPVADQDPDC